MTGPYEFVEWRKGATMTLAANEEYFDGAPSIKKITIVFAEDDNTRAQQMRAGDLDATVLPPALAHTFEGGEFTVVHHRSADYRTVTMPSSHPVTGDPAVRHAMNLAINRQGMIDALLAGKGVPASTPVPAVLDSFVEPAAQFRCDPAEAGRILDAAGWVLGADGIRARNGQPARFTLMYPATDTVRKDLAQAVVSDAKAVGISVVLEGLGWEAIEPRMADDSLVLGGGSQLGEAFLQGAGRHAEPCQHVTGGAVTGVGQGQQEVMAADRAAIGDLGRALEDLAGRRGAVQLGGGRGSGLGSGIGEQGFARVVRHDAGLAEDLRGQAGALAEDAQQDVFGAEVAVLKPGRLGCGSFQRLPRPWGEWDVVRGGLVSLPDGRQPVETPDSGERSSY